MKEANFEGKNVEEALLKASQELGVNIGEMTYEVLEQETGLFGLFGKSVTIRVRVSDDAAKIVTRKEYRPGPGDTGLIKDGEVSFPDLPAMSSSSHDEEDSRRKLRDSIAVVSAKPTEPKGPRAKEVLETLLGYLGLSAEITVTEDDESAVLNISSEQRDDVVGRDGELLAALQFLVNKIVNRFPDDRKLIVVDAEGFRDQRQDSLKQLGLELAQKAMATQRAVRLSPMSAQDRRIVHLTLRDHQDVSTRSEGMGSMRRLVIIPKGFEATGDDSGGRSNASRRRGRRRGPGGPRNEQ